MQPTACIFLDDKRERRDTDDLFQFPIEAIRKKTTRTLRRCSRRFLDSRSEVERDGTWIAIAFEDSVCHGELYKISGLLP